MDSLYIKEIKINNVRHLQNVPISISDEGMKHLIITGKNGSGKTSLLEALSNYLNAITTSNDPMEAEKNLEADCNNLKFAKDNGQSISEINEIEKRIKYYKDIINEAKSGIDLIASCPLENIRSYYEQGKIVVAYYKAERSFKAQVSNIVEKVELKETYAIHEAPKDQIVKYLLDMKMTQALAKNAGKLEKAEKIQNWFDSFEQLLKDIFEEPQLQLVFDEDSFLFHIEIPGRNPFDFNTLSSGYAAILDIVVDLMLRMERHNAKSFLYELPGIVLVDEIETHLHLELQKKILKFLTTTFPNVQFIVTTHSPFVINSIDDVTIFDLESQKLVKDGLTDVPYSGIVEGYFQSNERKQAAILRRESQFAEFKRCYVREHAGGLLECVAS